MEADIWWFCCAHEYNKTSSFPSWPNPRVSHGFLRVGPLELKFRKSREDPDSMFRFSGIYCPLGLLCRGHSNFPVRPASVVRLSVCLSVCHTQFWTPSESNCTAHETIRGQNRVRLGHFAKAHLYEDNPNVPLAHSRLSAE